ncbi:glutamate--cysteine ligase [Alteromonas aestuariivivens]|uniref:Glutamate--cysteine ligase n=1 Tax=Alteromonas aestuariivivens TaxID=1938339 RepID=A0A3D8MAN2_9ALTE|nr:glutamate--cysteine ligase [Alteromonas aestuariivivens]RDV27350.1 glutamate--cysteine ligase [Alteromonas aestuariivivens]
MGRKLENREFTSADFEAFNQRIHQQADRLKSAITQPNFGQQPPSLGAEIEIYLLDSHGEVNPVNQQLIDLLGDNQFQTELNQYNLELNLSPVPAQGTPFSAMVLEMLDKYQKLLGAARQLDVKPLAIGTLPTMREEKLTGEYMTREGRYRALSRELLRRRGQQFEIRINGDESLNFTTPEIVVEGANTSMQVHLTAKPEEFADVFNASQLTLAMSVAMGANSGVFMHKCLWDETRVALFKQSIDSRIHKDGSWRPPSRVTFGKGWVRKSAWEVFAETVNLYDPILPQLFDEDPAVDPPVLAELNLHMGTTWPWNRAIYDHHGNGHLRVEQRALPAGPSAIDMAANAAFAVGMISGLKENVDEYLARLPFDYAEYNFYRAAKQSLNASILWPQKYQNKPVEVAITSAVDEMLRIANDGLSQLGVELSERDKFLNIIHRRLVTGVNGAIWTKKTYQHYKKSYSDEKACQLMLERYYEHQYAGEPVAHWEQLWR